MKNLWKNNRVLFMLIIVLIVCFTAIVVVAFTFFYSKEIDKYGTRLKDIEKYTLKSDFQDSYKDNLLENENILKVSFDIKGRIIYVIIEFDEQIKLDDAKNIATKSLELFEDDILTYYDIQFILKSENFTIIGAKNAIVDHISWNNNKEIETEEEDEK